MAADWSLLPSNLVDSVALLLSAADQARMAATCKPWRLAMADGLCRTQRKPSIWIVLASFLNQGGHGDSCEFQSFSEGLKRTYVVPMPAADAIVLGSSQGWLMLEDAATRIHAFNPITEETLSFPVANCFQSESYRGVKKAVIVRREGLPVMAAIIRRPIDRAYDSFEVAVAEPGDDEWIPLHPPQISVIDIAVHQKTLYVFNCGDQAFSHSLRGKNRTPISLLCLPTTMQMEINNRPFYRNHLGFVSDKPALVRSWTCRSPSPADWIRSPLEVFTLDSTGTDSEWVRTKDLDGHAILVGFDGIIALRAEEFEELEADCVYGLDREVPDIKPGIVVVNVKTGAMTFDPISVPRVYLPIWFLPNLDERFDTYSHPHV